MKITRVLIRGLFIVAIFSSTLWSLNDSNTLSGNGTYDNIGVPFYIIVIMFVAFSASSLKDVIDKNRANLNPLVYGLGFLGVIFLGMIILLLCLNFGPPLARIIDGLKS